MREYLSGIVLKNKKTGPLSMSVALFSVWGHDGGRSRVFSGKTDPFLPAREPPLFFGFNRVHGPFQGPA
jgi:hypothetical protein